jgi:predicted ester cyclase
MTTTRPALTEDAAIAVQHIHTMTRGTKADMAAVVAEDAHNRESKDEPPETRGAGPDAFYATAEWLRTAFSDLAFDIHDVVQDGDLVVVHATMSGRHTGPFVTYRDDESVKIAFPATQRTFAVTQTHWFRIRDHKVVEHWANRDDLGMAEQLGWTPPTPAYLIRMLRARRQASRGRRGAS